LSVLPRISIVTPSYNQGQFIEQTILSVLNQDYPNLEYVVIDGGSTDDTVSILEKYSDKLTYWVSAKDRGQSHAINKGIELCSGEIFNWLNSDDFLQPGALLSIGEEYRKSPFTALCCRTRVLDGTVLSHIRKPSFVGKNFEESIAKFNINQEGTWFSFDAVKQIGCVNETLHYCMDLNLWFQLLSSQPFQGFRTSDSIVSNFRRHLDAKSTIEVGKDKTASGFFFEQLVLFESLKPKNSTLDYFDLLGVKRPKHEPEGISFSLTQNARENITDKRLFYFLNKAWYASEIVSAKKLSAKLSLFSPHIKTKDLFYIKRKLLFS